MKYLLVLFVFSLIFSACSNKKIETTQNIKNTDVKVPETEDTFSDNPIIENTANYNNGNGTVVSRVELNNKHWTIIKHETVNNKIGWQTFYAYNTPGDTNDEALYIVSEDMIVSTLEIAYSDERDNDFELWIKIMNSEGVTGWIKVNGYFNPYNKGNWAILDSIEIDNKYFTVRKLDQDLKTITKLNVRDKPDLSGNILFQLNPQTFIKTLAIIEESQIIDGINDHWVKIIDEDGKTGWIFGGYTTIERGGPKYYTPESTIRAALSPP